MPLKRQFRDKYARTHLLSELCQTFFFIWSIKDIHLINKKKSKLDEYNLSSCRNQTKINSTIFLLQFTRRRSWWRLKWLREDWSFRRWIWSSISIYPRNPKSTSIEWAEPPGLVAAAKPSLSSPNTTSSCCTPLKVSRWSDFMTQHRVMITTINHRLYLYHFHQS